MAKVHTKLTMLPARNPPLIVVELWLSPPGGSNRQHVQQLADGFRVNPLIAGDIERISTTTNRCRVYLRASMSLGLRMLKAGIDRPDPNQQTMFPTQEDLAAAELAAAGLEIVPPAPLPAGV